MAKELNTVPAVLGHQSQWEEIVTAVRSQTSTLSSTRAFPDMGSLLKYDQFVVLYSILSVVGAFWDTLYIFKQ